MEYNVRRKGARLRRTQICPENGKEGNHKMKNSKKFLALALALVMVFGLVACTDGKTNPTAPADPTEKVDPTPDANPTEAADPTDAPAGPNADDIDDNMTSEDGKYQVAFITDVGQLKDKSFNQGTYAGVKLSAAATGTS